MNKLSKFFCLASAVMLTLCSCNLLNKEVKSVGLSQTELVMTVGDTAVIDAHALPENAENKGFEWTSSDSSVATVENGTVKAKAAGSAVIKAKSSNGVEKSCNVTVNDKEIASITLSSSDVSVKVGKKVQLTYKLSPLDAPDNGVKWSSADEKIAVVNSKGYITGVSEGIVNITCTTDNGKEASCTVTVKDSQKTSATVGKDNSSSKSNGTKSGITTMNSTSSDIGLYYQSDFIFYDSSSRILSSNEIYYLSDAQIQQAINEIYARNGHIFTTPSIRSHYEATEWYIPIRTLGPSDFNSTEAYNIKLLTEYR